jgi:TatD DNase family protein
MSNQALLIDSHTHLDFEAFDTDRAEVIARADAVGVTRLITIGAGRDMESARAAVLLAGQYAGVFATVGVHPHDAACAYNISELEELASNAKVVGIGETGLDFYRDWCPVTAQYQAFEAQIELALRVRKPLIIHSREAGAECLRILQERGAEQVGGVFHCFSESVEFARQLADINFLVSFPGTLTFKKAQDLRAVARDIPLTQIMVETDAPYMAPTPHRGQRCESAYVVEVARVLAEIKGVSFEECCKQVTSNTERLFGISL